MEILKTVLEHASKDPTRYYLNGIFFDQDEAVATDGFRMIRAPYDKDPKLWAVSRDKIGKIYSFKEHTVFEGKFPDYRQFINEKLDRPHKLNVVIPSFFKAKKTHKVFLSPDGISHYRPKGDSWIAVDAKFLTPYAGMDLKISWRDQLSPAMIETEKFKVVLMPMKD